MCAVVAFRMKEGLLEYLLPMTSLAVSMPCHICTSFYIFITLRLICQTCIKISRAAELPRLIETASCFLPLEGLCQYDQSRPAMYMDL